MSRTRYPLAVFTALTTSALVLAGCASNGGSTTSSSSSAAPSASASSSAAASSAAPSANASIAAMVPSSIASTGTLSFAIDATYPPDEMIAPDGKTIIGFDADLANALAAVMGLTPKLQNVTFDNIIPGLQSGKFDVGLSSFTDTKAREKVVDFVDYFQAGEGFYVKAGSGMSFDGLASLCGHTVAVENGTTEQSDAQAQAKKCTVKVLTFSDQNAVNLAVSSGRADVGFADSQVVGYIVKQSNGQFEQTGTAFAVAPYGIALPKGNGMAQAVQAALQQLMTDGTYNALLTKWGIQSGAIQTPTINGAIS